MNSIKLFLTNRLTSCLPDTSFFALKRMLYKWAGATVGRNVRICSSATILGSDALTIGDNVWIGHQSLIVCSAPVTIGSNVNIAPRVYIGTGTHEINPDGLSVAGKGKSLPIRIGSGAWLCANSQILAGVSVGDCSIVAMGGVVLKDVPSHEVWGGVPAKMIRKYELEK